MRIIHRIITYTLSARDQSNGQVTLKDLVLLDVVLHGRKVDTIAKISSIKDVVDGVIEFGIIVTMITEDLRFRLEERDMLYLKNFTEKDYNGYNTSHRCK